MKKKQNQFRYGVLLSSFAVASLAFTGCSGEENTLAAWDARPTDTLKTEQIRDLAKGVDSTSAASLMTELSVNVPERGSDAGRAQARAFIKERFESLGLRVEEQAFTSSSGRSGANIAAELRGEEGGKHIYIGAHMDSVSNAGANDNASGVVGLILAARQLSSYKPRDTIHFIAYDLEEVGYYGSVAYVRDHVLPVFNANPENVIGNINLDMIGHEGSTNTIAIATCSGDEGGNNGLTSAITGAVDSLEIDLGVSTKTCSGRSDHMSYYNKGMPASFLIDNASWIGEYTDYHKATDTIDKVQPEFLARVIASVTGAVATLAYPSG